MKLFWTRLLLPPRISMPLAAPFAMTCDLPGMFAAGSADEIPIRLSDDRSTRMLSHSALPRFRVPLTSVPMWLPWTTPPWLGPLSVTLIAQGPRCGSWLTPVLAITLQRLTHAPGWVGTGPPTRVFVPALTATPPLRLPRGR